jgi:hypothetical protein
MITTTYFFEILKVSLHVIHKYYAFMSFRTIFNGVRKIAKSDY